MRFRLRTFAIAIVWFGVQRGSTALDYNPTWVFSSPIGEPQQSTPFEKDSLTYDVRTGSLVYQVGIDNRWAPPDVGSKSGLLNSSAQLHPVPLGGDPTFQLNETFEKSVVLGSNAIRIYFDRLAFWPYSPESPEVLAYNGLDQPPKMYSYGAVLPAGLAADTLKADLYATSFPSKPIDLRVVPEPDAKRLFATFAVILSALHARSLRNRKEVGPALNEFRGKGFPACLDCSPGR